MTEYLVDKNDSRKALYLLEMMDEFLDVDYLDEYLYWCSVYDNTSWWRFRRRWEISKTKKMCFELYRMIENKKINN